MVVARRTGSTWFSRPTRQLYFVHVPKCGGRYITGMLGRSIYGCPTQVLPAARGHKTYLEYKAILAAHDIDFDAAPIFAVVRNPWDWHVSWFHYIKAPKGGRRSDHWLEHALFQKFQFRDYIDWLEDPLAVRSSHGYLVRQVSDWVVDHHGSVAIPHVLRQESLEQDFRRLVQDLDLRVNVVSERCNTSRHADYRTYYTSDLAERIGRRHQRDVKLFGYCF